MLNTLKSNVDVMPIAGRRRGAAGQHLLLFAAIGSWLRESPLLGPQRHRRTEGPLRLPHLPRCAARSADQLLGREPNGGRRRSLVSSGIRRWPVATIPVRNLRHAFGRSPLQQIRTVSASAGRQLGVRRQTFHPSLGVQSTREVRPRPVRGLHHQNRRQTNRLTLLTLKWTTKHLAVRQISSPTWYWSRPPLFYERRSK